jgi:hypothetical protein
VRLRVLLQCTRYCGSNEDKHTADYASLIHLTSCEENTVEEVRLDNHGIKNNYWTTVKVWIFLTTVFTTLSVSIKLLYNDPDSYILMYISFLSIDALQLYLKKARQFDQLLKSNDVLARWFFIKEEWSQYINKYENTVLSAITEGGLQFLIINVFVVFVVYDQGIVANPYIAFALLIITELITICIYINLAKGYTTAMTAYVLLSTQSVSINGDFYTWSGNNRLEKVIYIDNILPVISLTYSSPSKFGRTNDTIKIPVPTREKGKVGKIIDELPRVSW